MIINELSREIDSYYRSAYFHKDRDEKINAGPLWDYDLSFGVGGFFSNNQIAGWQCQQTRFPAGQQLVPAADARTRRSSTSCGPAGRSCAEGRSPTRSCSARVDGAGRDR